MVRHVPVRQALDTVAKNPDIEFNLEARVWEAIAYKLFWLANTGGNPGRGQMTRKNKAQQLLAVRIGGRRRSGTLPIGVDDGQTLEMIDLTEVLDV